MERRPHMRLGAMVAAGALAFALIGCKGDTGPAGANGINGTNGTNGTNGNNGTPGASIAPINAGQLTTAQWAALKLQGQVMNVDMSTGTPSVTFLVTDQSGNGIAGLGGQIADGSTNHMQFAVAKLMPGDATSGAPSRWVDYLFVEPTTPVKLSQMPEPEVADATSLKDNLDGSYTYTFKLNISKAKDLAASATVPAGSDITDLDDLTYDTAKVHRLLIMVGGAPSSSNPTAVPVGKPLNLIYDFLPSAPNAKLPAGTDTRTVVDVASCNNCHTTLSMHADYMAPLQDTRACVVCHTDQMKFGSAEANTGTGTLLHNGLYGNSMKIDGRAVSVFTNLVHKIHMGDQLSLQSYAFFGTPMNSTEYPQDVRNCTACHTNQPASSATHTVMAAQTPNGDAWMSNPSRLACGACHDDVNFVTGANHGPNALAQSDDHSCAGCHGPADNQLAHVPFYVSGTSRTASNPDSAKLLGAHVVEWAINKVTLDANFHPTMTFQVLVDGQAVALNAQPTAGSTSTAMIPGFVGGPTVYFNAALPQDGLASSDYNYRGSSALTNFWAQVANVSVAGSTTKVVPGSFTDNGDKTYTVVMTSVTLPANTTMLNGCLGASFAVQTDLGKVTHVTIVPASGDPWDFTYNASNNTGGLAVPTRWVQKDADPFTTTGTSTGTSMVRRAILKQDACLGCHQNLGFFTASNFHSGNRNDANSCVACHNTTRSSSNGDSINAKNWMHGIHSNAFRTYAYTPDAPSSGSWNIEYPGILNNCETCHVPGAVDYSNADSQAQVGGMLWDTITQAYVATKIAPLAPAAPGAPVLPVTGYQSPFLTAANPGGTSIVANLTTGANNYGVTQATGGTAVVSPITAACTGCHDSQSAVAHMRQNGGVVYATRTNTLVNGNLVSNEQCLVCHGNGKIFAVATVHGN